VGATACLGALGLVALLLVSGLGGCATPAYISRGGLLWHPRYPLAVPDLSFAGWERVTLDETDLAFRKKDSGVIAVRARCPAEDQPLRWESRDLWLGIPRRSETHRRLEVDGRPAVATTAQSDGLAIRTAVVRTEDCALDLAHVAPTGDATADVFERFLERVRLRGPR
jgi:hypothetical protein